MTIMELKKEAEKLKNEGIDPNPLITEIHQKISLAFSSFVFMLLGIPLAIITRRREKSINFGIAFLIVIIYYPLLLGSEALAKQGYLDPTTALWIPNIIFGLIGLILTYKICVY